MQHIIRGNCHCQTLSFELRTQRLLTEVQARACDCSFCRKHGAKNWSDPEGEVIIQIRTERQVQRYRFGLRTADFLICPICGVYLGAVLSDIDGMWSTVNLRLTDLDVREQPASYGSENTSLRVARRKRAWTPTKIVRGA